MRIYFDAGAASGAGAGATSGAGAGAASGAGAGAASGAGAATASGAGAATASGVAGVSSADFFVQLAAISPTDTATRTRLFNFMKISPKKYEKLMFSNMLKCSLS
jgi:hypothetical protein